MEQLAEKFGYAVMLNIMVENHRICIGKVESKHDIHFAVPLGRLLPVYAGAAGKVLIAFMPEERILDILRSTKIEKLTPNTVVDIQEILLGLKKIREQRYGFSQKERVDGVWTLAAPVRNHSGEVIASLSMGGPNVYFDEEVFEIQKLAILNAARQASVLLGCSAKLL